MAASTRGAEERLADLDAEAWAMLEEIGRPLPVGGTDGNYPYDTIPIGRTETVSRFAIRRLLDKRAALLREVDGEVAGAAGHGD